MEIRVVGKWHERELRRYRGKTMHTIYSDFYDGNCYLHFEHQEMEGVLGDNRLICYSRLLE